MADPRITFLLDRAAGRYAAPDRPTVTSLHRELRYEILGYNAERSARGLSPTTCPSLSTLRRRVRLLDRSLVSAARRGKAVQGIGRETWNVVALGDGRVRGHGRNIPVPSSAARRGKAVRGIRRRTWNVVSLEDGRVRGLGRSLPVPSRARAEHGLAGPRAMGRFFLRRIEAGDDASALVRASVLLDVQDSLACCPDPDPGTLDDLRRSIDHVLLCLAWTAAATPDELRRRVRLFGRRQEHGGDVVGIALANSVERDRRRHQLAPDDVV